MIAYRWLYSLLLLLLLAACSDSPEERLRNWMQEQKSQTVPRVAPLPEPKQFVTADYTQDSDFDPFSANRLAPVFASEDVQDEVSSALLAPELVRRREPLEEFPLDSMTLVGNMIKDDKLIALVRTNNLLYQVGMGGYMGQNYGKVTKITETEIGLREIVQDAQGKWVERAASLQLQEK